MRLSDTESALICRTIAEFFGSDAGVSLFGSRVDDTKRGGDVDLYVKPNQCDDIYLRRIHCLAKLTAQLPYPVDLVIANETLSRPIDRIAVATGVVL
ncbi:MAG: nucleotidyltransferase domain-containing protein [Rhodocyclaceae bacterium]|nr:nucleotidyltransferase domain-containing protein [Rhodocyclaceae bacterium]